LKRVLFLTVFGMMVLFREKTLTQNFNIVFLNKVILMEINFKIAKYKEELLIVMKEIIVL